MSPLVRRLLHLLGRSRHDAELQEEIETHRTLRQDAFERDGLAPEEAAYASRRALGNVALAMDDARDVWVIRTVDSLWQDVRRAARSLTASKAFTAGSILTLALGIGANAAIFSILNGVILRPLGYPKADQLMLFSTRVPSLGLDSFWVSPVEYFEFRELNQSFSNVGAFHVGEVNLFDGDQPHRVRSAAVDEHLLATLGIPAAQGRLFASGETNSTTPPIATGQPPPGTAPVVILSHEFWQSVFGGRPLLGRYIDIERVSREVIGFAAAPLVHTRMKGLATAIREGTDRQAGSPRQWARACLVIAEVALAVILVAGAGLLARSVLNLTHVDPGFNRSHLVTFSTTLPQAGYPQPESRARVYQSMLERIRSVPGVASASAMSGLPPERILATMATDFDNYVPGPNDPPEFSDYTQYVLGGYFQTMGIPIVQGRGFEPYDDTSPDPVVVVNRTLAETFWKGIDPIGQRLRPCCSAQTPWFTVVGIAADVKQGGIDKTAGTEIYFSLEQMARRGVVIGAMHVVLRTTRSLDEIAPSVRSVVRESDPTVPIVRLQEMDDVFRDSIRRPRLLSNTVNIFAGLALLISAIGIYGLLSYTVTLRRREIGVRMALGASRAWILAGILRWGLALVLIGTVTGAAAAIALSQSITSLLFGIAATDATTLIAVVAGVMTVGTVAWLIPAWRASRVDPLLLIREN